MIGAYKYCKWDVFPHYFFGRSNNFVCEYWTKSTHEMVAHLEYRFKEGSLTSNNCAIQPGDFNQLIIEFLQGCTDVTWCRDHATSRTLVLEDPEFDGFTMEDYFNQL